MQEKDKYNRNAEKRRVEDRMTRDSLYELAVRRDDDYYKDMDEEINNNYASDI